MALSVGSMLGPYRILETIGAGGMGEVYRAHDARLGRDVAVKIVTAAADPEGLSRFEREARATAALAHPNIVTVFDIGVHDGVPFLVSELLDGQSLRERLSSGPMPLAAALDLAVHLARAVAAAHALRIIHRDLKPENLFITRSGVLKVLDFGLAKLRPDAVPAAERRTIYESHPGLLIGTPAYMAPEQVRGEPADERTDIFAIGAILSEMISGASPFRRDTPADTLAAIIHEPPALDGVRVPESLKRVVLRCLHKNRAERFETAADLAFALELVIGELRRAGVSLPNISLGTPQGTSIAVLPFADMSPGRDQDYLCEGIAEEVINALTHVAGLRVAARSSSFQFRSATMDVRAIGARLGVSSVLEGSVRKIGDRLRVTVQLVDVQDGFHVWSQRYDQRLEDVFAIEDEIARNVASALRGILTPQEQQALRRRETAVECYEYFLRARRLINQFDRDALVTAEGLLKQAIAIDPEYAPAHAALAEIHGWFCEWWGGTDADYQAADAASKTALKLAPQMAESHAARGFVLSIAHRYDDAAREFEEAIRLNPNLFEPYYLYARSCFAAGHIEQSADLFLKAGQVQPEDFQSLMLAAQSLKMLGREEEARQVGREGVQRAERRLDLNPGDARALSLGSGELFRLGQPDRALQWSNRALELHPEDQGVLINSACLRACLGMKEEAIALLERTFAKGFGKRDWIERDPDYDSLRDDPRFQALLQKLR